MKLENYSVIMSIYNKVDPKHLEESINSVLNQTHKTNEFILIKDGKLTNEQERVINTIIKLNENIFKIIDFINNRGAGEAYNAALKICTNKWAAIMDSDDIVKSDKFEKQMRYALEHNDIDVIATNAVEFYNNSQNVMSTRIMPETNDKIIEFAHGRCPVIQPTAIFKVLSVIKSGSYQNSPLTEDYDLYIRMIQNNCKFYTIQETLYYIRANDDFFKRRGGIKYLKPILSFKYKYYKSGFFTFFQFIKTFSASLIVAIIPNWLRIYIYKKFLRN